MHALPLHWSELEDAWNYYIRVLRIWEFLRVNTSENVKIWDILLYSHLLGRCSNVEVLGDIIEQIIIVTPSTGQYHCVFSNLMNIYCACLAKDVLGKFAQKIWNKNLANSPKNSSPLWSSDCIVEAQERNFQLSQDCLKSRFSRLPEAKVLYSGFNSCIHASQVQDFNQPNQNAHLPQPEIWAQ